MNSPPSSATGGAPETSETNESEDILTSPVDRILKETYYIRSKSHKKIFCRTWLNREAQSPTYSPSRDVKCVIFLCHTLTDHSGFYSDIANILVNDVGALVISHDLVGHGKSEGSKSYVQSLYVYVNDIRYHQKIIYQALGICPTDVPFFLFGQSFGGTVCILFTLMYPKLVQGMILSSPFLEFSASSWVSCLRYPCLRCVLFICPHVCPCVNISSKKKTSDEEGLRRLNKDPLVYHGPLRVATYAAVSHAIQEIAIRAHEISCPIFLGHAEWDRIGCRKASEDFIKRCKNEFNVFNVYEGASNFLLLEYKSGVRDRFIAEVTSWLKGRLVTDSSSRVQS